MLETTELNNNLKSPEDYRLGIEVQTIYNQENYGHGGLWDTYAIYSPKENVAIAVHFTDGGSPYLIKKIISLLNQNL